jgi:IrrE N-terminal-like domain
VAKSGLRRGFVTEAHWWADQLRKEMGVAADAPLCPKDLCNHLSIPVLRLSSFPPSPERDFLLARLKGQLFSAAVLYEGTIARILINDAADLKRQASDIAHEVAHVLLGHPPVYPFINGEVRDYSPEAEAEAEYLGPALLVSERAALRAYGLIKAKTHTLQSLSDAWQVSSDVLRWRMNAVGASKRLGRAA